jgi:hypothetical protein
MFARTRTRPGRTRPGTAPPDGDRRASNTRLSGHLLAGRRLDRPAQARAAVDRIAAALPPDLRPAFLERGQLVIALAH